MKEKRYFISDAAKELEVESHVLRYWEEELNLEIPRNEMGHRYYREEEIEMLKCVKELKARGFQLKTIRQILNELQEGKGQAVDTLRAIQAEEIKEEYYEEQMEVPEETAIEKERYEKVVPIRRDTYQENASARRDTYQETTSPRRDAFQEDLPFRREAQQEMPLAHREMSQPSVAVQNQGHKLQEFEEIMKRIVGHAMKENSHVFGEEVGEQVSERVIKEMDYLMRLQEEREEKHFQNLDNMIRQYQRGKKEAAAARVAVKTPKKKKRKSLFFQKRKKRTI